MNPGAGGDMTGSVDGYGLRSTSPALNNGSVISDNGGRDHWANPVPATTKPHRGAYNGPGVQPRLPAAHRRRDPRNHRPEPY